jgi:tripartite-type tricarboxylate transporter receptor subunit TctC
LIKQGKIRALGVTSRKRSPLAPDVEAIGETVPGFENTGWYALVAPLKTPPALIDRINGEVVKALRSPDIQAKMSALGAEPIGTGPAELKAFLASESEKLRRIIKAAGMRPK